MNINPAAIQNVINNVLKRGARIMDKKKVAFICVHNSCRSQIAEALGHYLASDFLKAILQEQKQKRSLIKMLFV